MLIILIVVWIIDSFLLKRYTITNIPLLIRLGASILLAGGGVYLVQQSHKQVIESKEQKLVEWGVYSITRHPMYLGIILFELGIIVTTLSIPALLVWVIIFIIYNKFAAYEEKSLIEVLGNEYNSYQKKVKRWGIF
jgi:protein-S-isoprenylcysteine O-methyltransferase Ste14